MEDLSSCKVLIVDDAEENIDILVDALGELYDVSVAMDGESALEAVSEEKPDIILLDIMMPGMNGYDVCKRIQANPDTAGVPIVFMSALDNVGDRARGLELGAVDYIIKPFDISEIQDKVRNHLIS